MVYSKGMRFPLFKVHVPKESALERLGEVFDSGFINEGIQVSELEIALKSFLEVENLTLTNSCTSALTLALRAAGVGVGDEVLTISMTCIATNTPIINLGARIVWVDIDPSTGSIDVDDLEKKVTSRTRAIMFVAWAGNPCDLDQLSEIRKKYGIPLIQDAAHAFDAKWETKPIAAYADFTCYSFQAIKHFTTGDGGAIVCSSQDDYDLVKKLKWFGYDRDVVKDKRGEWKGQRWDADIPLGNVGYKFNMNNVAAAIGLSQLPFARDIVERHRVNGLFYRDFFGHSTNFRLLETSSKAISSNWVFTMIFRGNEEARNSLLKRLIEVDIGAGLVHLPNHTYSAFVDSYTELRGTVEFAKSQISLPCGWWITPEDSQLIAEKVESIAATLEK